MGCNARLHDEAGKGCTAVAHDASLLPSPFSRMHVVALGAELAPLV